MSNDKNLQGRYILKVNLPYKNNKFELYGQGLVKAIKSQNAEYIYYNDWEISAIAYHNIGGACMAKKALAEKFFNCGLKNANIEVIPVLDILNNLDAYKVKRIPVAPIRIDDLVVKKIG